MHGRFPATEAYQTGRTSLAADELQKILKGGEGFVSRLGL